MVETQTARRRLEEILAELDRSTVTLRSEHAGEDTELSTVDQHLADAASNLSDADRETALLEAIAVQRGEVTAALERIETGSYGRCVDCGEPLPDERLEARPEAARCVSCQSRTEGAR